MKNFHKHISALTIATAAIIFFAIPLCLKAQTIYKLLPAKDVSVKVLGSSNIHDWTMNATSVESQGDFKIEAANFAA